MESAPTSYVQPAAPQQTVVQEPAAAPITRKPEPVRRRVKVHSGFDSGMVSIKKFRTQKEEEKAAVEDQAEDLSNKPRTAFTEEEFKKHWEDYIELLKRTGKSSFASTMRVSDPKLDGFKVVLELENTVQENEFNVEKTDLSGYLRRKLNNYGIQIEYHKVEVKETVRYYTNKERFARLTEINPHLKELAKRLNIDPDF